MQSIVCKPPKGPSVQDHRPELHSRWSRRCRFPQEEPSVPVSEITDSVQTQVLDLINKAQDATIDSVRTLAGTVEGFVPELPALPFTGRLPQPSSGVDHRFASAAH